MTSRSLRKHRITRSNILQKITASALATAVGLLAAWPVVASDDGAISLRSLRPLVPTQVTAQAADSDQQSSYSLLHSLRAGGVPQFRSTHPVVPPVPSPQEIQAATYQARQRTLIESQTMKLRPVLLTGAYDETAGTVTAPELLPPAAPIDDARLGHTGLMPTPSVDAPQPLMNSVKRARTTRRGVTRLFHWNSTVSIFKPHKGVAKTRGRLIEFYDPEDERPDVDNYDMPILLVAAQEQKQPVQEVAHDDGDRLLKRKLTDIQPTLAYAWGDKDGKVLPADFYKRMDHGEYASVEAPRSVLQWEPTNLWYYPLYFEDPGLERYGHTRRPWVQPFVSTGRFMGQVATLPYQMALHPPKCPQYTLGYYQPGEWAPKKRYQIPFNEEAAATQFLWMTALILMIP